MEFLSATKSVIMRCGNTIIQSQTGHGMVKEASVRTKPKWVEVVSVPEQVAGNNPVPVLMCFE